MNDYQVDIFGNKNFTTPNTQGIKYAGSKLKILPYIVQLLGELDGVKNVLDGFSGTTRVSQALAQLGYNTTASDISAWSEVFGTCYLKSEKEDKFYQEILDHLNNLRLIMLNFYSQVKVFHNIRIIIVIIYVKYNLFQCLLVLFSHQ